MKYPIIICLFCIHVSLFGQQVMSTAHDWEKLQVEETKKGFSRKIYEGSSKAFQHAKAEAITLNKRKATSTINVEIKAEELLIIKEGNLKITLNGKTEVLGAGSVIIAFGGSTYKIKNLDKTPSTYYVISWEGVKNKNTKFQSSEKSFVRDWKTVKFRETDKGGWRDIVRQPTPLLEEFEMHVTTLNEGMISHPPHTHIEAEIILIRKGEVEELIDGKAHNVGAGSLIFLDSQVPHGIRNIGKGQCEYYAFKWKVPSKLKKFR